MRKVLNGILLLMLFASGSLLHAESNPEALPLGKNYLDPDNIVLEMNYWNTMSYFKVKSDTDYVFSFPSDYLTNAEVTIDGYDSSYLGDFVDDIPNVCSNSNNMYSCVFHTSVNETHLNIEFNFEYFMQYYDYFELQNIQLEEGTIATAYEPYAGPQPPGSNEEPDDTTSPEFSGSGAFVLSYADDITINEIISAHIQAIDEIDGDLSNQIIIVEDNYSLSPHTVGEYLVSLEVSDSSGNKASFGLTVIVKDEVKPVITGGTSVQVDVNNSESIDTIISREYEANDGYDGNVNVTVIDDGYTGYEMIVGTYNVTLQAVDLVGNVITKPITIIVEDNEAPSVDTTQITVLMSDPKSLSEVMGLIVLSDNYDDNTDVTVSVTDEQYSNNTSAPGSYTINFTTVDLSSNLSSHTVTVIIIDDVKPVISGPTMISASYTEGYALNDFINMLTVSDNVDDVLLTDLVVIEDTYSTRQSDVGTFIIVFNLFDNTSNMAEFTINITTIDDVAPVIYVDNYIITLSANSSFNENDALKLLQLNNELPYGNYTIKTLRNEYVGNENSPGTYTYSLSFESETGEEFQKEFMIKIPEDEVTVSNTPQLIRNITLYTASFAILVFIGIKKKK